MRTFFRLLYNEFAWTYDLVAWLVSFGQWKAWGCAAISRLRGPRVLDLAHGPGHLLVAMRRAGFAPIGLDLSPQMGRLAKGRWERERSGADPLPTREREVAPSPSQGEGWGQLRSPPLVRARAQAMPFCSGTFDSIVSTFPAEFIFDPATLQEIARVMKPEGQTVVVIGVTFKQGLPARLLRWLYRVTYQDESAPPGIANAVAKAGLTLEREREPMSMVDVLLAIARKR